MKKLLLSQLFILGLMMFLHTDVFACSCETRSEPLAEKVRKAKAESDAIFTGSVLSITENTTDEYISVELKVIEVWKGEIAQKVTVLSGLHDGNCRYPFKVGKLYLVYAHHSTMYSRVKSLSTGICTRTSVLSEAESDVRVLGKTRKPRKS